MGNELYQTLIRVAKERGILLCGGADISSANEHFRKQFHFYKNWIDSGAHGKMEYLSRGKERRGNLDLVLGGAQSVFSVAVPYRVKAITRDSSDPKLARYLFGIDSAFQDHRDYHLVLKQLLEGIMAEVKKNFADELKYKVCVDTSAVLERTWAYLAGLGWIGKNKMLIHPQFGSYLILGEIILNRKLDRIPSPMKDYCGNCRRCMKGCPTEAISEESGVDSRKCISYLTLEHRGELSISLEQKRKIGTWVAGCDVCQEVCPFNTKAVKADVDDNLSDYSWRSLFEAALIPVVYQKRIKPTAANCSVSPNRRHFLT